MLASLIMIAANLVDAQTNHRFVIDIPFDFIVMGRTLPAGSYAVERLDPTKPNLLMIKNADNRTMRVFLTQRIGGDDPKSRTSTLVFRQHGRAYYLFQVWVSDDMNGSQLLLADEISRPDRRSNNSTLVRVKTNSEGP